MKMVMLMAEILRLRKMVAAPTNTIDETDEQNS